MNASNTGTAGRISGKRPTKAEAVGGYVGREDAVGQLIETLTTRPGSGSKLVIQSIEGPGGIGKTALFEHVLQHVDRAALKYMTMKGSGKPGTQSDPFELVQTLIASSETPTALRKPLAQRFTNTEEIRAVYGELTAGAKTALQHALPELPIGQLMRILNATVGCGQRINTLAPRSKLYLDFDAVEKSLPKIEAALKTLPPLLDEVPGVLDKLGLGKVALRNAVRANALNALAEAFVTDLTALLAGYQRKNFLRPSQARVQGLERLLLVVDDYESLVANFGEFLVSYLVPRLKQCSFETVLVIIGRDQLALGHPGWNQHHQRQLAPAIALSALCRQDMDKLVLANGRTGREELDRAWADTLGYPLLVCLWMDEAREAGPGAGPSIGMLKRFHDRTTHWLNEEQKCWLDHALFLPKVNVETFTAALGDRGEAKRAMKWFECDGSVRDAQGKAYCVRPYVLSRLVDYLEATDPDRARELRARASPAAGVTTPISKGTGS